MSETNSPQPQPATVEKKERTVIGRLARKMAEEHDLKTLSRLIDEAAGPNSGITLVVLDLSHVTIMPSLGLGLLVQVNNKCKARQQKLKLAGVLPPIRQVFAITRLDRMFEFVPNADAAVE